MTTAILVIWSIGIVVALLGTLVLLKQVFLLLATLSAILHLARITQTAAEGIAANADSFTALVPLGDAAQQWSRSARRQAEAASSVARKLDSALGA